MATGIKTLIQEIVQKMLDTQVPTIVQGVVEETSPISIALINDTKVRLSAVSLTIPDRLKPIEKGEKFYMLSTNKSQMYYLLDRT